MSKKVLAALSLGLSLSALGATSASAALHYYDHNNWRKYLGSLGCHWGMHDVRDDVINSVKNQTACSYSARSWNWIPNTTIEVAYISRRQSIASFGSRNNQIDHFDR